MVKEGSGCVKPNNQKTACLPVPPYQYNFLLVLPLRGTGKHTVFCLLGFTHPLHSLTTVLYSLIFPLFSLFFDNCILSFSLWEYFGSLPVWRIITPLPTMSSWHYTKEICISRKGIVLYTASFYLYPLSLSPPSGNILGLILTISKSLFYSLSPSRKTVGLLEFWISG